MEAYLEGYFDGLSGPPRPDAEAGAAPRESADDYPDIVAVLNHRYRVISWQTVSGHYGQWILQQRTSMNKPNRWQSGGQAKGSFCQTRDVLLREIDRKVQHKMECDPAALALIAALPDRHPCAAGAMPFPGPGRAATNARGFVPPPSTSGRRPELPDVSMSDDELAHACRASGLFGSFWTDTAQGRRHLRNMVRFRGGLSDIEYRVLSFDGEDARDMGSTDDIAG